MDRDALQARLDDLAEEYLELHERKEQLFWETRMGLSGDHAAFGRAEQELRAWFGDEPRLARLEALVARGAGDEGQRATLAGWVDMIRRNAVHGPEARAVERDLVDMEVELERKRGDMELGWVDPATGERHAASSVVLSHRLRTEPDEARRRAAWEGLRELEGQVLDAGFCEVVAQRNRLAHALGHDDYYEFKARRDEGMSCAELFGYLDELSARTAGAAAAEQRSLVERHGAGAALPWNIGWHTSGSLAAERDPWFRFEDALERWGRSFAGLGIRYRGARVTIDLVDRAGKYENGFMHGPVPAFFRRGRWQPAHINFTANAVPDRPGAGQRAMETLFHEGGHAAHFANIRTSAPCFSQEFAPTSVAFAETQSMLLDSLLDDADWQWAYARNEAGERLPDEMVARELRLRQPARARQLRSMMSVCYFERALYSLPAGELAPGRVAQLAREVEDELLLAPEGSPRPMLSIPHLLGSDSSCYYHGYVLATMALEQTKAHLRRELGTLVDNPAVGERLTRVYWEPGNAVGFREYVRRMTGQPLGCDALVAEATRTADEALAQARELAERQAQQAPFTGEVDLGLELEVVHGPEVVVPAGTPFAEACRLYRDWLGRHWPATAGPA